MQRLAMFRGLKGRITLLTFIPMLAVSVLASAAGVYSLWQLREARMVASLDGAAFRAEAMLRDAQSSMATYGVALAQQAALIQAISSGDMPLIRTRLTNAYEQLRASDPRVSILEVTDARGRVLLRGHNPALAGDDKSAVPDVARALRGETAPGVIVSPTTGELAYGAAVPLRLEGRVVGTLKVAGRMDANVARQMGRLVEGEVLLVGNGRLTASTLEGVEIAGLASVLAPDSRARTAEGDILPLGGAGDHRLRVVPVTDIAGRQSGAMVIALPMAPWYAAQRAGIITTLLAAVVVLLVAQPIALLIARRIGQRLQAITAAMGEVSAGRLDSPIPDAGRRDEIGAMAQALAVFQEQARQKDRLEAEAAAGRRAQERRSGAVQRYTEDFGTSMDGVMASFQQAAERMQETAGAMTRAASLTREQVGGAAAESARTSENLTAVAAAVEELSATVGEISRQISSATTIAADAVREARASDERMQALTNSAERIGQVLALISDVAGRTNLLALNATIEAARAGEAGKGFAVVASEVKALAAQTAKATEEIGAQIGAMRDATGEAAGVMRDIAEIITRMDEATAAIAAAVEQQSASTREITGRLQSVALATNGVSEALRSVSDTAEQAGRTGEEVQGAANQVQSQAAQLGREVRGFLDNLASGEDERRRFERRDPAGRRAWLLLGGEAERVAIRDISLGGMAVESERMLPAGTPLRIGFGETQEGAVAARVARCEGGVLGIVFADAQSRAVVETILRDMPMAA